MLLSHQSILDCMANGVLENGQDENAGPVSYDLTTQNFFTSKESYRQALTTYMLNPGDSVFVASVEIINLPDDLACSVLVKNSRLREGLRLDAPLYFPGHRTRVFFRITNVSGDSITLDTGKGIAQLAFEKLDRPTDKPYVGAFSDESAFKGLGDYESLYEGIERRIYGNVMTLMAIFAAVFTLININMGTAQNHPDATFVIAVNLATVGSFAILAGLISLPLKPRDWYVRFAPWAVGVVCFVAAIYLFL